MNRRHRTSALVLAVIVSAWVDQAQAQQPAKDMAAKDAEKRQYEARRGLAGFEWIEPLYPDCPKARFKLKNDECGGVKKHPRDPEDVLEDYWRRSVWAYTLRLPNASSQPTRAPCAPICPSMCRQSSCAWSGIRNTIAMSAN